MSASGNHIHQDGEMPIKLNFPETENIHSTNETRPKKLFVVFNLINIPNHKSMAAL